MGVHRRTHIHRHEHAHTCMHTHARTCTHGHRPHVPSRDTVSLTPVWGRGQSPDTAFCGLTLETQPRVEKAKSPELRSVPKISIPDPTPTLQAPTWGLWEYLESSSSASSLQKLLPSPAYELECPQGQGAHDIPGHPPQCQAAHDMGRILA